MKYEQAVQSLHSQSGQQMIKSVYPDAALQTERCLHLLDRHKRVFGSESQIHLLSAPGRSEIIGNHTDHNNGIVLACAVNLDITCAVSKREDLRVNLDSEGYEPISLSLTDLEVDESLAGTTAALIRGVASGMKQRGYQIGGFDAVMNSQVFSGSGLSSSAAFEVMIAYILDVFYNKAAMDALTRAQIGQYAENVHFMKPCGLMDQMASSFGGLVKIDFKSVCPDVETIQYSFAREGYAMVIVNTRSSHDDLTEAYSAIPREMKAAAGVAGGLVLREIPFDHFKKSLPIIRKNAGDRAVLRAVHFYRENERVEKAAAALKGDRLSDFFDAVNESGLSSETLLQNIHVKELEQPMTLALMMARVVLNGQGACRVHGGGFAGTTLNFVPDALMGEFVAGMEGLFGSGCCHKLDVRSQGPITII